MTTECPRCGMPMHRFPLFDPYSDAPFGEIRVVVHLRCFRCDIIEHRLLWYDTEVFNRMERDGTLRRVIDHDLSVLLEREPVKDPSRWRSLVRRLKGSR